MIAGLGYGTGQGATTMITTRTTDLQLLRQITIFSELDDSTLVRIAESGTCEEVPADTTLFERGERPRFLHILLRGQVALSASAPNGASTVIEIVKPVDHFVLPSALLDVPYLMSGRTIDPCRVVCLPAAELRALLESEPRLAVTMMASLSQHYRQLVRQIADLKLRTAAQRLGCYLLALSETQESRDRLFLTIDKRLLAARLGATPEHLSRAFATLREHGVSTRGSTVTLQDSAKLAAFSLPDEIGKLPLETRSAECDGHQKTRQSLANATVERSASSA
jgi:CRP/FNR family transcriptional regulator, transcriptional activator FtrB